jgi:hypothetical protein
MVLLRATEIESEIVIEHSLIVIVVAINGRRRGPTAFSPHIDNRPYGQYGIIQAIIILQNRRASQKHLDRIRKASVPYIGSGRIIKGQHRPKH